MLRRYVLLRVIRRVCEDTRIYSSHNSIGTLDDNAMGISFHELLVQHQRPYSVYKFPATMCEEIAGWHGTCQLVIPIVELVWELVKH